MVKFIIRFIFGSILLGVFSLVTFNIAGGPITSFILSKAFDMDIKIGAINFWGKDLSVRDVKAGNRFSMRKAEISFLLKNKRPFLDEIYIRGVSFKAYASGKGQGGLFLPIPVIPAQGKGGRKIDAPFRSFLAEDGKLSLCNNTGDGDKCVLIRNIRIKLYHPSDSLFFNVDLSANIGEKGEISAKGWIDWDKKDADIDFKARDIDLTDFREYSNMNALSGVLSLKSKAVAKDDALKIDNELVLNAVGMNASGNAVANGLVSALSGLSGNGHISVKFSLNTKLSQPDINLGKILSKIHKERRPDEYVKDTAIGTAESVVDLVGDVVGSFLKKLKK